jgi:hypothetical protein
MKSLFLILLSVTLFSCENKVASYSDTPDNDTAYTDINSYDSGEAEDVIDCSDAKSAASYGYDYARKAYNSDNLEDIEYYAKKAMNEFESSMSYASDCGCDDANYAADEAYSNARKAYNAETVEDGEYYAKKAMNAGEEVESYATDCEDQ